MKHYKVFILALLSILFCSCTQQKIETARFSPYTVNSYYAKGPIKTIIEQSYNNKAKLQSTDVFKFDTSGRITSYEHIVNNDTVSRHMIYKDNGQIENVLWDGIVNYTPEFNEYGDLVKETYITEETDGYQSGFIQEYTYDTLGNVIYAKTCYFESDCVSIEYLYENNKLTEFKEYNMEETTHYECDSSGLAISRKVYDDINNRISEQSTFKYKFDSNGNWIEKVEQVKKRTTRTNKRSIQYYSNIELAAVNVKEEAVTYDQSYTGIAFIDDYANNVRSRGSNSGDSPNTVLFIILIVCSIALAVIACVLISDSLFQNFTGRVQSNGMKKMWMYNPEPYAKVGTILLIALVAFIASIALILLVGALIWGILWLVRLILLIIIFVGWACLILGGLAVFAKEPVGCLPLIIGILIVSWKESIKAVGEALVNWGFELMQSVNMFNWGLGIFSNYWDVILIVFITPMVLFLAFALIVITLNMLLNLFEFVATRIYSIRRPCPVCGSTETPDYIIGGKPHPVKLHPGIYGVFTHKSPVTGASIPTMLLNGRGKIRRKCRKCNSEINADTENTVGTEIHIGIVGHRSSGKSYLLYSGLSSLMSAYPDRFSQIDAVNDTQIDGKKKLIDSKADIQTAVANKYRAVQLILKSKMRPVPYHLFFYDVAGEKFNAGNSSNKNALDFYRNVQSIVFIVDPSMVDISGIPASSEFVNWHKKNAHSTERYKIDSSFAVLKDIIESVGRKSNKIDLNFVCTKTDMGYMTDLGYSKSPSAEEIERFMWTEMGLSNLINSAKGSFKSVSFYTVSAIDSNETKLRNMFVELLNQRKVSL